MPIAPESESESGHALECALECALPADSLNPAAETAALCAIAAQSDGGAVASFVGVARASDDNAAAEGKIVALFLEHYPGMTEKAIEKIAAQARARWPLLAVRVKHRVGRVAAGETIVFVGVVARHRRAALAACAFLIDYLKTRAPFWKKEIRARAEGWVEARADDERTARAWDGGGGE